MTGPCKIKCNSIARRLKICGYKKRAKKKLYYLRECRSAKLPAVVGITCYLTKIRPLLEYGAPIRGELPTYLAAELENIQSRSLDIIGLPRDFLPSLEEKRKTITVQKFNELKMR